MDNFDKALNAYFRHFGENYPLGIAATMSEDEIIDDIERCIEADEKAEEPQYEDDADY